VLSNDVQIGRIPEEFESLRSRLIETEERLAEANDLISAIRAGEVDAVVVSGPKGEQIFTLRGAEYAYRALVEAINEGAATLTLDGTILYCNQHLAELLALPLEQIIGRPFIHLIDNTTVDTIEALLSRALSGSPAKAEIELRSGGRLIPVQLSINEMRVDGPVALCMVVTDLTETKRWEQMVSAGKLASSILESSAEAIAVCDETGKIVGSNAALKSLCECNPQFENFDRVLTLLIEDVEPPVKFTISSALTSAIRSQEVLLQRRDGSNSILLVSSGQIAGEAGIAGCVLTLTDITRRKQVEQALVQTEKLAAVGRLASSIAHEINNPLEAVTNLLYLARGAEQFADAREFLASADRELRRVAEITSQTLRFHRQSTSPREISCLELIEDIVSMHQTRILNAKVTVEQRLRATSPIRCFEGEIRQVLSNLVTNAVDSMRERGGRLLLRTSEGHGASDASGVFFTIADEGTGMSPKTVQKAFEAFFTTKGFNGTGLGLWVCREIMERHRGRIQLRSKQGPGKCGTVVRIFLPFAAVLR
jgi:PAS domain S-box-containing protein